MVVITVLLLSIIGALRSLPQTHEATQHILNHIDWFGLAYPVCRCYRLICMAARWRALMPETLKPPHGQVYVRASSKLCRTALRELGAAWFAHKRYPISLEDSLASGISARLLGLMTTAILGVVIWLLFELPVAEEHKPLIQSSALLIGCGGILVALLAAFPMWWQTILLKLADRFPHDTLRNRLKDAVTRITTALIQVLNHHPMRYARAFRLPVRIPLSLWNRAGRNRTEDRLQSCRRHLPIPSPPQQQSCFCFPVLSGLDALFWTIDYHRRY